MTVGLLSFASLLSGFNNGKSQMQAWDMGYSGEYPFLNLMKQSQPWSFLDNSGAPGPDLLDANGYPTSIQHSGVYTQIGFPVSRMAETMVATWDGQGTFYLNGAYSGTTITVTAGNITNSSGSGRVEFTVTTPVTSTVFNVGLTSYTGTYMQNVKVFYKNDESALNAGQVWGIKFLSVLQQANPGVFRFLDLIEANNTNVSQWAYRKSVGYFSYSAQQFFPSIYAGVATASGMKKSITFGSGAPVDKQTIHMGTDSNAVSITANGHCNWTAHGLVVGLPIQFRTTQGSSLPSGVSSSNDPNNPVYYFVITVTDANNIVFSATQGGSAVGNTGSSSGTVYGSAGGNLTENISISNATAAVLSWPNHGLSAGSPFYLTQTSFPTYSQQVLYVLSSGLTSGTFQYSMTPGGTACNTSAMNITGCGQFNQPAITIPGNTLFVGAQLSFAGLGGVSGINGTTGTVIAVNVGGNPDVVNVQLPGPGVSGTYTSGGTATPATPSGTQAGRCLTLSYNGTTTPLLNLWGSPLGVTNLGGLFQTLVFDASMNGWLSFGGDSLFGTYGVQSGIPLELALNLCTTLRCHPHFVAPFLAVDPMSDYIPQLATYVKANGPSWMKPRFEGPNECWNPGFGFYSTPYSQLKAPINWGPGYYNGTQEWYGKVISTIGQAVNAVYGGTPSTQTNYAVIDSLQTVTTSTSPSNNDPRLSAPAYVAQSAAAQSGYVKSAAYNWATHVCMANYWNPSAQDGPLESSLAYDYSVTNIANPTNQAADLAALWATSPSNLTGVKAYATTTKAWGAGFGVNKMTFYEGGPGFSYPTNNYSATVSVITQATNAVITMPKYNQYSNGGSGFTGQAFTVGQPVTISGVNGMTQINNQNYQYSTCNSGSPGTVSLTAHGYTANQPVTCQPADTLLRGFVPFGLNYGQAYYVKTVIDANTFTVSATAGGTAIAFTATQAGVYFSPCWVVTAITTSTPFQITLNVNSSAFTAYANDGSGAVSGGANAYQVTALQRAAKNAPGEGTYVTQNYNDMIAAGGEFPSQYTFGGIGNWTIFDPDIYITTPPAWTAIATFNN